MASGVIRSADCAVFGEYSMKIQADSGEVWTDPAKCNLVAVSGYDSICVSAYIRHASRTSGVFTGRVQYIAADKVTLLGTLDWHQSTLSGASSFTRFYAALPIAKIKESGGPQAGLVYLRLMFGWSGSTSTGIAYVDGIKAEPGVTPTAWSPYPLKENDSFDLIADGVTYKKVKAVSASGEVTAGSIQAGAVGNTQLSADAVTREKIADSAVGSDQLDAEAVTQEKVAAGAIGTAQISPKAVTTAKLGDYAVETLQIGAGAVTSPKIGAGSVDGDKLAMGAVQGTHLADEAVDLASSKVSGQLSNANLAVIQDAGKIQAGLLTEDKLDSAAQGKLGALNVDGTVKGNVVTQAGIPIINTESATVLYLMTPGGKLVSQEVDEAASLRQRAIAEPYEENGVPVGSLYDAGGGVYSYRLGLQLAGTQINIGESGDALSGLFGLDKSDGGDLLDANGDPVTVLGMYQDASCVTGIVVGEDEGLGFGAGWWANDGGAETSHVHLKLSAHPASGVTHFNVLYSKRNTIGNLGRNALTKKAVISAEANPDVTAAIKNLKGTPNWNTEIGSGRKLIDLTDASGSIASGKVVQTSISTGAVGSSQIGASAVIAEKIQTGAVTEPKLGTGSVTADKIGTGAISESKLAPGAVSTPKLADSAVVAAKLGPGAVTEAKLSTAAVTETKLGTGAVSNDKLSDGAVSKAKMAANSVGTDQIEDGAVGYDQIAERSVATSRLAYNAVSNNRIVDGAVGESKIAEDAVSSSKLAVDAASLGKMTDNALHQDAEGLSLGSGKKLRDYSGGVIVSENGLIGSARVVASSLAENAVTTAAIAGGAVNRDQLAAGAVGEGELADEAVTSAKLADAAVDAGKIAPGAVTTTKLGPAAVTEGKLGTGAVTVDKLGPGAVTEPKLGDGAVSSTKLASSSVTESKLATGAVTAPKIASGAVETGAIAAGAVNTDKLANGAVSTDKIAPAAVTQEELADGAVSEDKLAHGAVTADKLATGSVSMDAIDSAVFAELYTSNLIMGGSFEHGVWE